MAGLANLRAEIQVRTTAQHIWAEASQTLLYKNEKAVPQTLKRAIYRVSALLETVDLEFERVLSDRDDYKAEVAQTALAEETLDVDTLQQVLDESWPSANKDADGEDYADLLTDLYALGVTTPSGLRKILSKWRESALAKDTHRVTKERKNPDPSTRDERVSAGVFFTHGGLTRVALEMEFPQRYKEYFHKKWKLPLPK